jgi:hypothetical protein
MDFLMMKTKVWDFIQNGAEDVEQFNSLAVEIFHYQYKHNQAYREYCRSKRIAKNSVKRITDIPPVPIGAFKYAELSCSPASEVEAIFTTSGTTNPEQKGKNFHRDLDVWKTSMSVNFAKQMMATRRKMKMVMLFPTEEELPNSSLAHYLANAKQKFGTDDSEYVVSLAHFDMERLVEILLDAEESNEPIMLLGATFSFVHFLDFAEEKQLVFSLPEGSVVMDTGGAKGRSREVDPVTLKGKLSQQFSVPIEQCMNMYGMTELSSQCYDMPGTDEKIPPHWMHTSVIHPETMKPVQLGEKGIIVHYDLANYHSAVAVMTEYLAMKTERGFKLLGRATGAEARGCSLAVEQFISSSIN